MKRMSTLAGMMVLLLGVVIAAHDASAQSAKDVVGTYTIVSAMVVQGDKKVEPFGPTPQGVLALDGNGRDARARSHPAGTSQLRSNNRDSGTAEENMAVVKEASPISARTRWQMAPSSFVWRAARSLIGMDRNRNARLP